LRKLKAEIITKNNQEMGKIRKRNLKTTKFKIENQITGTIQKQKKS